MFVSTILRTACGVPLRLRDEAGVKNPFEGPKLFSPSFVDALRAYAPELLELKAGGTVPEVPHGTTVAAVTFADGWPWAGTGGRPRG